MEQKEKKQIRGIKIRSFNACMIVLSCMIFVCLIYNTVIMPSQYNELITHTNEYRACEEDAAELSRASDYLTEQVRLYVENMDIQYMENYFREVHESKRRENALAELENHETTAAVRDDLRSALESSNDLMAREIYAMKLISVANNYSEDGLPQEVRETQLKERDAELSSEKKIEKARSLVFDSGYQDAKALIRSHLNHFLDGILGSMSERQASSQQVLERSLSRQRVLISVLFILNMITFAVITILIVRPLTIHIKRIKENNLLEITGSYEFKYLALTYNDIYELNAANKAMLAQKAEHDPLTGLMNRGAFDDLKSMLRESSMPLALVILDVDRFKLVNDNHGHEIGDRALKKVASLLTHTFRVTDYVIRLGGDEFAVIMTEIGWNNRSVLEEKVSVMNLFLQNPNDDLPPISLSAGAAFSDRGFAEELFQQADQALYYVKEHGRCGCHIFDGGQPAGTTV